MSKISKIVTPCSGDLPCGSSQLHAPVVSLYRRFLRFTSGSKSQSRKRLRNFFQNLGFQISSDSVWRLVREWKLQSRGLLRKCRGSLRDFLASGPSSREKHLDKFFKFFFMGVFGDLFATYFNCKNHVFCTLRTVFKNFSIFPRSFCLFIVLPVHLSHKLTVFL